MLDDLPTPHCDQDPYGNGDDEYLPEHDDNNIIRGHSRNSDMQDYEDCSPQRKAKRTSNLNNKYEDIFALSNDQERIFLDKINIDGRFYYSMWQLKQKLSERMPMDVGRKNKLRYIIQNRTKKDSPKNVIKLLTRPAKEQMGLHKDLLTPNKYSTFVSVDELQENASFGFLSGIIEGSEHDTTPYHATEEALGRKPFVPTQEQAGNPSASPVRKESTPHKRGGKKTSLSQQLKGESTSIVNAQPYQPSPVFFGDKSTSSNLSQELAHSYDEGFISPHQHYQHQQLQSFHFHNQTLPLYPGGNSFNDNEPQLSYVDNSQQLNKPLKRIANSVDSLVFEQPSSPHRTFERLRRPHTQPSPRKASTESVPSSLSNSPIRPNSLRPVLPPLHFPSSLPRPSFQHVHSQQSSTELPQHSFQQDTTPHQAQGEGSEAMQVVDSLERSSNASEEDTLGDDDFNEGEAIEAIQLLRFSPPHASGSNIKSHKRKGRPQSATAPSSSQSNGTPHKKTRPSSSLDTNNCSASSSSEKPNVAVFANVPPKQFECKGTLYTCTINGVLVQFLTSIDLKNLLIEQLCLKDKNKINGVAQSLENALSSESPRFDISSYNNHFEFSGRNNFTRVFVMHDNRVFKQKYHIFRDADNSRWLLKMLKNYKHIDCSQVFVLNDSQFEHRQYKGPTEKIASLLENLGYFAPLPTSIAPSSSSSEVSCHGEVPLCSSSPSMTSRNGDEAEEGNNEEVPVLVFREELNEGSVSKDFCFSNRSNIATFRDCAKSHSSQKHTCITFGLSPSPTVYHSEPVQHSLFSFQSQHNSSTVHFITESALLAFAQDLPVQGEHPLMLDTLCGETAPLAFPDSSTTFKPFFLVEMSVPGRFTLRRAPSSHSLWHLFVPSLHKTIVLDCSALTPVSAESFPSLSSLHKELERVSGLHRSLPTAFAQYSGDDGENAPPSCWLQLLSRQTERKEFDVFLPWLGAGHYELCVSYFSGSRFLHSLSIPFHVLHQL